MNGRPFNAPLMPPLMSQQVIRLDVIVIVQTFGGLGLARSVGGNVEDHVHLLEKTGYLRLKQHNGCVKVQNCQRLLVF